MMPVDPKVTAAFILGQTFEITDKDEGDERTFTATVKSVNKGEGTVLLVSHSRGSMVGSGRRRRLIPWQSRLLLEQVKPKRGKFETPWGVAKVWEFSRPEPQVEFELIESDLPYGGRLYRVLRDGEEIGWVESYVTSNDSNIAGTRLRRIGADVTRWHVAPTRRGLHSRDERIGVYHESRREAVRRLVEHLDRKGS